jgi:hypothetical protein
MCHIRSSVALALGFKRALENSTCISNSKEEDSGPWVINGKYFIQNSMLSN